MYAINSLRKIKDTTQRVYDKFHITRDDTFVVLIFITDTTFKFTIPSIFLNSREK